MRAMSVWPATEIRASVVVTQVAVWNVRAPTAVISPSTSPRRSVATTSPPLLTATSPSRMSTSCCWCEPSCDNSVPAVTVSSVKICWATRASRRFRRNRSAISWDVGERRGLIIHCTVPGARLTPRGPSVKVDTDLAPKHPRCAPRPAIATVLRLPQRLNKCSLWKIQESCKVCFANAGSFHCLVTRAGAYEDWIMVCCI